MNHRKMCHWALLIWGLFEVLSDHGETTEDDVVVDESSDESTGTMPPLPLVSWFKETGRLENVAMATTAETLSSIVGIGGMNSLTYCSIAACGPLGE